MALEGRVPNGLALPIRIEMRLDQEEVPRWRDANKETSVLLY